MGHTLATVRGRRREARLLLSALALVAAGSAGMATLPASAVGAGLVLPIDEPMTGSTLSNGSWLLQGTAQLTNVPVGDGWMELTPTTGGLGSVVLNEAFPTSSGVVVEFDYSVTQGNTGQIADGFSFYLLDGATVNPTLGTGGGGLGYRGLAGSPGVSNGYVGIGFDEWGNYTGQRGIGIRGSGNGETGYAVVASKSEDDLGFTIAHGPEDTRRARIRVLNGVMTVMVKVNGVWKASFRNIDLASLPGQVAMPASFKMGFSASTGTYVARHQIRNVRIAPAGLVPDPYAIKHLELDSNPSDMQYPVELVTQARYENSSGTVTDAFVKQPVLGNLESVNAAWTCVASAPGLCPTAGTGDTTGIGLSAGSGSVTVSRWLVSDSNADTVDVETGSVSNPNDWWIEPLTLSFPEAEAPEVQVGVAEDTATPTAVPVLLFDRSNETADGVSVVSGVAAHGQVTIIDGEMHYRPEANFVGDDVITYKITDGTNFVTGNVVGVTVTPVNDAPLIDGSATPAAASLTTSTNRSVNYSVEGISDVDSPAVSVTITTPPTHGTAVLQYSASLAGALTTGQIIVYTPADSFVGADSYTFSVSDGSGGTVTRTVTVNVLAAELPATGASSGPLVALGGLSLLIGMGLVGVARRRMHQ